MDKARKAIIAFLSLLGTWGATAAPGGYDQLELWGLCGVVVGALAVYEVDNVNPQALPSLLGRTKGDGGRSYLELLALVVIIALVVFGLLALLGRA